MTTAEWEELGRKQDQARELLALVRLALRASLQASADDPMLQAPATDRAMMRALHLLMEADHNIGQSLAWWDTARELEARV